MNKGASWISSIRSAAGGCVRSVKNLENADRDANRFQVRKPFRPARALAKQDAPAPVGERHPRTAQRFGKQVGQFAFADYGSDGSLLGIELLAPCGVDVLDRLAENEPDAVRQFLRHGVRREMIRV